MDITLSSAFVVLQIEGQTRMIVIPDENFSKVIDLLTDETGHVSVFDAPVEIRVAPEYHHLLETITTDDEGYIINTVHDLAVIN